MGFENIIGESVLTDVCRLQYPYIASPDVGGQYSDDRYKAHFLYPKEGTDFGPMRKVVEDLSQLAFKCSARELEFVPFKDGDSEKSKKWQGFAGCIYVLAKSKYPPDVWSAKKDPQAGDFVKIDPKKVYAGLMVRAQFTPLAYMSRGNERGITFLLDFIQWCEDAPRFGGIGSKDARDVLAEYGARGPRTASQASVQDPDAEYDGEANEPPEQTKPEPATRGRGRPKAQKEAAPAPAEPAEAEEAAETPSQRARRLAAEARARDEAQGTAPTRTNGAVADLPVGGAKPKSKSANSLMDML